MHIGNDYAESATRTFTDTDAARLPTLFYRVGVSD